MTEIERRLAVAEARLGRMGHALAQAIDLAKKGTQDVGQMTTPVGANSDGFYRCQVIGGSVAASTGATLGTGNVRQLKVISGARYCVFPHQDFGVVNDTGGPVPINTFCIARNVDGILTLIVADCATVSPSAAPDEPH